MPAAKAMGSAAQSAPLVTSSPTPSTSPILPTTCRRLRGRLCGRRGELLEDAAQRRLAHLAEGACGDAALRVDHEGRRDRLRREGVREQQLKAAVAVDHVGVGDAEALDERPRRTRRSRGCRVRRTARPVPRTPRARAASAGASARHGAHQEAHTFSTTASPRWSLSRKVPPSRVSPTRSGAGARSRLRQDHDRSVAGDEAAVGRPRVDGLRRRSAPGEQQRQRHRRRGGHPGQHARAQAPATLLALASRSRDGSV